VTTYEPVGVALPAAGAATPVPDRLTLCGPPGASSIIDSVPVMLPVVLGVNVTTIEQVAPGASVVPQLLTSAKSPATEMFVRLSVSAPTLVSATIRDGVVVLTICEPKPMLDGKMAIPDAIAPATCTANATAISALPAATR